MQITFDLIERYAMGTATPEERAFVNDWLENGEDNDLVSAELEEERIYIETKKKKSKFSRALYQSVAWIALVAAILLILRNRKELTGEENWISRSNTETHIREFILPDGSVATLAPGAEISFSDRYGKTNRKIEIKKGTVYLDVIKDSSSPLTVKIAGDIIDAPGTRFEVCADNSNIVTTVLEGKIRYNIKGRETIALNPGQQLSRNAENGVLTIAPTDTMILSSWRTGALIFNKTPLRDVIRAIEKKHDIRLVPTNTDYNEVLYTGNFLNEIPSRIVEIIFEATGINFEIED